MLNPSPGSSSFIIRSIQPSRLSFEEIVNRDIVVVRVSQRKLPPHSACCVP